MRPRFPVPAASPLSVHQERAIRTSLSLALSQFNSFCTTSKTSSQCQEPDSLKKFSTSSTEVDDFSELGEPLTKNGFSSLKLMTEKPNRFLKPGRSKDVSSSKSNPEVSIKDFFSTLEKPSRYVDTSPGDSTAKSRTTENTRDQSHIKRGSGMGSSKSVAVENLRTSPSLSTEVKPPKTVDTKPGDPTAASKKKKNTRNQPRVKRQAVLQDGNRNSNSVAVENVPTSVSLSTVGEPHKNVGAASSTNEKTQNVTLRILGLSHDTSLDVIHLFLKSVGCLEEIAIRDWGSVEAVFRVKADSDLKDILDKLNGAIINERRISADILHSHDDAAALPLSRGKRNKMGLQVSSHLKELHNQFNLHALYAEDLYNLHVAIMHLESRSGTSIGGSSLAG